MTHWNQSDQDLNAQVETLLDGLQAADPRVLARCISYVESTNAEYREIGARVLHAISLRPGPLAFRIGFAGAAGAGKSTLINALGTKILKNMSLAVLTVDPSSATRGGSLLGDATRMADIAIHPKSFIRSTPSGAHNGGIAKATCDAITLCEYAGFNIIIVESLGSGQVEFELAHCVDLFYWLTTPGAGDDLQAMKQGVLEWVDGILVTQGDRGREALAAESRMAYQQGIALYHHQKPIDVMAISAFNPENISDLWQQLQHKICQQLKLKSLWFSSETLPNDLEQARQTLTDNRAARFVQWGALQPEAWCDHFHEFNELCDWLRTCIVMSNDWAGQFLQEFAGLFRFDTVLFNWHDISETYGVQLTPAELSQLSVILPADLFSETNDHLYWTERGLPIASLVSIPLSPMVENTDVFFSSVANPHFKFILGVRYQVSDPRCANYEPKLSSVVGSTWGRCIQSVFFESELAFMQEVVRPKVQSGVDSLTGLPNREAFREHLQRLLVQVASAHEHDVPKASEQPEQFAIYVFAIDIDEFRRINEVLGLDVGDTLLCLVAQVLAQLLEPHDLLSRFGGDEFFITKKLKASKESAAEFGQALQFALNTAVFKTIKTVPHLQCHIGCVDLNNLIQHSQAIFRGTNVNEVLRAAGAALFAAKSLGKNAFYMYDAHLKQRARQVFLTKNELYRAVAEDQFTYLAQPLFNQEQKRYFGAELLLRWDHPSRGVLPASEFIESADNLGIMQENDLRLIFKNLDEILAIARQYQIIFHLNLSAQLFFDQAIIDFAMALEKRGALPYLHFEITEHAFIDRMVLLHQFVYRVKAGGSQIWLDDFGVGYSGLRYLDNLDVDGVKIDQSFVRRLNQPRTQVLFQGMMHMLKKLDLAVLAEGVEEEKQAQLLESYGCVHQQGILHGTAKPLLALTQLLDQQTT